MDYLLDTGGVVSRTYNVPARQRFTVWVDNEGRTFDARLTASAFGIRITASAPIVAERAMYWGTPSVADPIDADGSLGRGTCDGRRHRAGKRDGRSRKGQQNTYGGSIDTFFLLANPQDAPVEGPATFVDNSARASSGTSASRRIPAPPSGRRTIRSWRQSSRGTTLDYATAEEGQVACHVLRSGDDV